MTDTLSAFARHLADRRSSRTVTTYQRVAALFADFTGIADYSVRMPTRGEIEAFLGRPRVDGRRRSPAGRNQELAALRALSAFARRDLGWTANPADGIPFLREPTRDPPVLGHSEVRRLFDVAAEISDPRRRSLALIVVAVLSQAALRVHELVALDVDQVDLESATLVGVRGKGGTVHDLPMNAPTVALLRAWLTVRSCAASEDEPALFISSRKTRLSIRSVQHLIGGLARSMGTAKRLSPHVLRHSAATLALTMGSDVSTVAELLRHSDLNVTRRYLHLVDTRRREAVRLLGATIPRDVLPMSAAREGGPDARPDQGLRSARESGMFPLDVQHGLDAAA